MQAPSTPVKLIVGLGNPGAEYAHTRHNAGQDLVEELSRDHSEPLQDTPKFFGTSCRIFIGAKDARLLVPTTFMNRSGQAVATLANFYKIEPEEILVIHDELDLSPGDVRLKRGGGHGGHNGLRDIISALGNNKNFARLRVGIGHPGNAKQVSSYVLKRAPQDQQIEIDNALSRAQKVIPLVVAGEWETAVRELHSSNPK